MKKEVEKKIKKTFGEEVVDKSKSKQLVKAESPVDIIKSDSEYHAMTIALDRITIFSGNFTISTMQDIELGARALREIDSLRERINERQDFFVNPLKEQQVLTKNHILDIKALFNPIFIPLLEAEKIIEQTILKFKELEKKRYEEEIERLEEKRKEEEKIKQQPPTDSIDSLFISSSSSDFEFKPPATTHVKLLPIPPPPKTANKTIHTSAGDLTTRYTWKVEVENMFELAKAVVSGNEGLPIEVLEPNIFMLTNLARDGRTKIPGCKVEHKAGLIRKGA